MSNSRQKPNGFGGNQKVTASGKSVDMVQIGDSKSVETIAKAINETKVTAQSISDNENNSKPTDNSPVPTPAPVVALSDLQEFIAATAKATAEQTNTLVSATVADIKQEVEALKTATSQQIETVKAASEEKLTTITQSHEETVQALKAELATATAKASEAQNALEQNSAAEDRLKSVMGITGSQETKKLDNFPNVNTHTTTDSDRAIGILADVQALIASTLETKRTSKGYVEAYNYWEVDTYVKENKKQVEKDLDASLRKQGMLQGNRATSITAAATTTTDLPGFFLETLSSMSRTTDRPGLVYWQFCPTELDFQKAQGTKIDLYRAAYQAGSTNPEDYKLSGGATFARIVTDGDAIQTGIVQAELFEWGQGKTGTTVKPVTVPMFVMAYSIKNLLQIIDTNIMHNYYEWEDLKIQSLWKATSRVLYNNGNAVTTDPTAVTTGSKGTFTDKFASSLVEYAENRQILPFRDGSYGCVLNTKAAKQLKDSYDDDWQAPTAADLQALTNILQPFSLPGEADSRVSGYLGLYENIHFFKQNAYGTGAAGTINVQNVTLNAALGSTLTRSSFFFGGETIGRGIGDPVRIITAEDTNYDRQRTFAWNSTQGFVAKDVDPTGYSDSSTVPQQLRVFEVRTLDTEV